MIGPNLNVADWNVRGLNDQARKDTVHAFLSDTPCHIACLQETKLDFIDQQTAAYIGGFKLRSFAHKPAVGTRGGILLLWNEDQVSVTNVHIGSFLISAQITIRECSTSFLLTTVYGPSVDTDKGAFLAEIIATAPNNDQKWLILGDFNLILQAEDKNNDKLNLRLMGQFRRALNTCHLKEIKLQNRKFTWSNERENPTLERLDRAFCNPSWDLTFESHVLHALSSSLSDHCPLLLSNQSGPRKPATFRFETFWTKMPGFQETVLQAWSAPSSHTQPVHVINHKLKTTALSLRSWSRGLFSNCKLQLSMALEVILQLDVAQDSRPLSTEERALRAGLKRRILGLVALERSRKRQASRINYLRDGDANTKFFHLRINSRKRKNHIQRLKHNDGWLTTHEDKENVILEHFSKTLGRPPLRQLDFNWMVVDPSTHALEDLDLPFSELEIKEAIDDMPSEKAPGPDGFSIAFFQSCWDIVKDDLMRAITSFSEQSASNFAILNTANIVLIPKKDGAEAITDFRPISLIHVVPKIIAKAMARRLGPKMDAIVSRCQSAFIKTRTIHDNFMYVRNTARSLHRSKTPALLIKLDIAKAFDTVRWDYLLDLLRRLGFPPRWRALLSSLFSSATSRVILNGIPGKDFAHGQGLRQGDPLSPLLFDIAIDPLQQILDKATASGLMSESPGGSQHPRISLYADDAAIFIAPSVQDISCLANILQGFGEVTGMVTNVAKSSIAPIRCSDVDLTAVLANFSAAITQFPLKYLGLPLSLGRLRRTDLQPYIDKAASRLNPLKGRFLNRAGCCTYVKSVLSSMPIFLLTAIKVDKGFLRAMAKICRGMLWDCKESVSGGKCKVNWQKVCRPKELGGLGILDLERFSRALRLRWLWDEWKAPEKPWVGFETPNDASDRQLFNAATRVTIGDGKKASFWSSSWLDGKPPKDMAPLIFKASRRKNRTVHDALTEHTWVADIAVEAFTAEHIGQFVQLWDLISDIQLSPDIEDSIIWTLSPNGCYSASSAYKAQFMTALPCSFGSIVWKTWAPPKCRFFAWLAVQNRLWTADRLAKRGWPHQPSCQLCRCSPETARHMLFECRYSKRIWSAAASWLSCPELLLNMGSGRSKVVDYWQALARSPSSSPKGLKTAIMLITWEIWKERNERVFNKKSSLPVVVMHKIREVAKDWILAGAKNLADLVG